MNHRGKRVRYFAILGVVITLVVVPAVVLLSSLLTSALVRQLDHKSDDERQAALATDAAAQTEFNAFEEFRPIERPVNGYVSSHACRECHPKQHKSWHASYHRSMTQLALPTAVIGDFDDTYVSAVGREYRLYREGEVCWVEMDNPDAPRGVVPRVNMPIVMTTGSHHMQVYWFPTGNSRRLAQLPLVYLKETQSWIPRKSAFLSVPNDTVASESGRWNDTCCQCHTTGPQPRPVGVDGWDTQAMEFGIACEACHGPGKLHSQFHRAEGEDTGQGLDPIINPSSLTHHRSAQVCGQCHSINVIHDLKNAFTFGNKYRPGDDLAKTHMITGDNQETRDYYQPFFEDIEGFMRESFWRDGMVRVSGREYNGLIETGCFQQGELSCVSCHALHKSDEDSRSLTEWANDQLAAEMRGNDACLQCHETERYDQQHTHHQPGSSGSVCYNCHMPHTTYGLLKAIRSHQISSPDVTADLRAGRPNACNLCHLDKTLAWSSQHLQPWYGQSPAEFDEDQQTVAASLLWLLRGDAGERALAAWSMGWSPALEASGDEWPAPFLACLLNDPYDAVRFIARRSLREQPGFHEFDYDFQASRTERGGARDRAWEIWAAQPTRQRRSGPALLIDSQTGLQRKALNRLLNQRDDRPVKLAE